MGRPLAPAGRQTAVYDGYLSTNPVSGTNLPRAGEDLVEEIRFLSHDEFDRR